MGLWLHSLHTAHRAVRHQAQRQKLPGPEEAAWRAGRCQDEEATRRLSAQDVDHNASILLGGVFSEEEEEEGGK